MADDKTTVAISGDEAAAIVSTIKAGVRTSEFWLTLAITAPGVLMAMGVIADGSLVARIVGGAMAVLKGASYTLARAKVKS